MASLLDFLVENGTPKDTVILILMLPIVALMIAVVRQLIGIKAFGIYTPLIVTFSMVETKLKYGLAIFILVLLSAALFRFLVSKLRLLYLPRMAIVITGVAFVMLLAFFEAAVNDRTGIINVSIFPIVTMIVLSEKFVNAQIEKGNKEAITLAIETIAMSIVGYIIIKNHISRDFIFNYPYFSFLTIPLGILLGKWTGLRLPEYWRFRSIWSKD